MPQTCCTRMTHIHSCIFIKPSFHVRPYDRTNISICRHRHLFHIQQLQQYDKCNKPGYLWPFVFAQVHIVTVSHCCHVAMATKMDSRTLPCNIWMNLIDNMLQCKLVTLKFNVGEICCRATLATSLNWPRTVEICRQFVGVFTEAHVSMERHMTYSWSNVCRCDRAQKILFTCSWMNKKHLQKIVLNRVLL